MLALLLVILDRNEYDAPPDEPPFVRPAPTPTPTPRAMAIRISCTKEKEIPRLDTCLAARFFRSITFLHNNVVRAARYFKGGYRRIVNRRSSNDSREAMREGGLREQDALLSSQRMGSRISALRKGYRT